MDGYYELKANGREVHASDFTRYTVVSEQLMGIFDPVRIQGNPLWFMHADIPLKIRRCRELINYKVQRGLQGL